MSSKLYKYQSMRHKSSKKGQKSDLLLMRLPISTNYTFCISEMKILWSLFTATKNHNLNEQFHLNILLLHSHNTLSN